MRKVIALDIGGTNTRAALVNESYQAEKIIIHPTVTGDTELFLKSVRDIVKEICPDLKDVIAIAGGVPGRVRPDGYINALPNMGISNIDLARDLHKAFGLPVFIRNDAEVAALAEANLGPYKSFKKLYFITVSTGVGGALCVNGKLRDSSYEVGHTLFEYKGELHEFEHLASGRYLVRMAKANGVELSGAKEFFEKVKENDPKIVPIYRDWIALFAKFIQMVQTAFSPDVFTFTGGAMKSASVFWGDLKAAVPGSHLEKCGFDQEAGLMGAAVFGFQNV